MVAIVRQVGLRIVQGIGDGQHRQAHHLAKIGGIGMKVVAVVVIIIFVA